MKERRRYPRLKSHLIAGFRRIDSLREYVTDMTEDISIGGFKVEVECPDPSFAIGRAMEITIKDVRENADPIVGIGRIVWMKEKNDRSGCEIGVMITYLKAEDRARYVKYFFEKIHSQKH